jgi:hypothetical protein
MIDTDSPQAPYIFAASRHLGVILHECKRITLMGVKDRRFSLERMRAGFAALRWLAEHRFQSVPIVDVVELERKAEQLADRPLHEPNLHEETSCCPACSGEITTPSKYDLISYCSSCLKMIMPSLCSCWERFGTDAI